jgi:uncharacterized membrane protein HdeD (DUF308 family)
MQAGLVDVDTLARNWWVVLLRGVAGILFGIVAVLAPGISLAALVLVFGAYAFADGVLNVASAIRRRGASDRWWALLLEGVVGIATGIVSFVWPGITALVLLYLIAVWALVTGAFEIGGDSTKKDYHGRVVACAERDRVDRTGRSAHAFSRPWSAGRGPVDWSVCPRLGCSAHRARPQATLLGKAAQPSRGAGSRVRGRYLRWETD